MSTLLLRNGVVHAHVAHRSQRAEDRPTALAVQDGRIVFVGDADGAAAYDGADEILELHGALVAPAFVDAHVHTVLTGFQLTRLDLRNARSLAEALDLLADMGEAQSDGVLVGTGWEEHSWPEGRPPTAAELDRATPGRQVLLERRDCHSSVVSPALAAAVPDLPAMDGYDESGRLERDARHAVSDALAELIGPGQRLVAARAAVTSMAAQGVAGFHEAAAPHIGPTYELDLVRHAAEKSGLLPTFYWGEYGAFDTAAELGAAGLAGDLNADGAIGSRTAALHRDYDDQPGNRGHAFLSPEEIAEHVEACTRAGLQAGFHCIGEAALDAVTEGFRLAEKRIGREAVAAARHRLEHVEMASTSTIAMLADLDVAASMQPLFDDLWGGPDQMYADRLGDRWRGMNPMGSMARAGVCVAFGSDTPVSPVSPWLGIRAAVNHRDPTERMDPLTAFRAHTIGGWRAARIDGPGQLAVGAPAHLAVWDCPGGLLDGAGPALPDLAAEMPLPVLRRLFVDGRVAGEESR